MTDEAIKSAQSGTFKKAMVAVGLLVLGTTVVSLYVRDARTPSLDQTASKVWAVSPASSKDKDKKAVPPSEITDKPAKVEIRAQLVPLRYTTLGAEIAAKINRINVTEGGYFRAGQVLVAFDCSVQRAQRDRSQAELIAARKTLAANRELEKLNAVGKLDLDLAASAVDRANADLRTTEAVANKCEIAAPFAGRVTAQKAREMQFVQQGQELLEIIASGGLELEFIAPSNWQRRLASGAKFNVRIDETGQSYEARLRRMGARVDPVSQSIKITAAITGYHPELMAGMSGVVSPHF